MASQPSIPPEEGATFDAMRWQPLGSHRYYVVADIIILQTFGELSSEELTMFLAILEQLSQKFRCSLLLADVRRGFTLHPEARRAYADWARTHPFNVGSTAVIGASLTARAVLTLITNAVRLVAHAPITIEFFRSKTEAMDWLDQERVRLAAVTRAR